jgi:glycosyltransferase involved in cell wall biosynthesis
VTGRQAAGAAPEEPLVTAAVCTFNRAHLVRRAVDSVLGQGFRDFELLIVDDGSTDATPAVLAAIDDPRVRTVRHARNRGVAGTRNTALRLARGRWMAYLDDDNEWAPEYLERQLAVARRRPAAGVVCCRARRRDARTGRETIMPAEVFEGQVLSRLVAWWNPVVSCTLIRRALLLEVGGLDDRLRTMEDRDLWLRLAPRTDFAGHAAVLAVRHVGHGDQLGRNLALKGPDVALMDAKWKATLLATAGRRAYRRWRLELAESMERARAEDRLRRGAVRPRRDALARAARLASHLPGSARRVSGALAVAVLGPDAWPGVRRRLTGRGARRAEA